MLSSFAAKEEKRGKTSGRDFFTLGLSQGPHAFRWLDECL